MGSRSRTGGPWGHWGPGNWGEAGWSVSGAGLEFHQGDSEGFEVGWFNQLCDLGRLPLLCVCVCVCSGEEGEGATNWGGHYKTIHRLGEGRQGCLGTAGAVWMPDFLMGRTCYRGRPRGDFWLEEKRWRLPGGLSSSLLPCLVWWS